MDFYGLACLEALPLLGEEPLLLRGGAWGREVLHPCAGAVAALSAAQGA